MTRLPQADETLRKPQRLQQIRFMSLWNSMSWKLLFIV